VTGAVFGPGGNSNKGFKGMKIGGKTTLGLGGVIAASVALNYAVLRTQVFPSFVVLEQAKAEQNLERAQDALNAEMRSLAMMAADWANWDDTYEFAADGNPAYIEENLSYLAHETLGINLIYVYDLSGKLLSGTVFDLEEERRLEPESFVLDQVTPGHFLLHHPDSEDLHSGIVLTSLGPIMLASRPILTNEAEGPRRGTFVMGRFLDETALQELRRQIHSDFAIWPLDGSPLSALDQATRSELSSGKTTVIREVSASLLGAFSLLSDPTGKPSLLLRVDTPKEITAAGLDTINYGLIFMLMVGLVVMITMWLLLRKVVVEPLSNLTEEVLSITRDKDRKRRLSLDRDDEVGILAKEFDRMLDELLQTEGMAVLGQITATVSHELRNPLGALRNSIFAVAESTRGKGLNVEPALERADRNIQRCDSIIDDLLDFARQREPNLAPVAIDSWLGTALENRAVPEGISLSCSFEAPEARALIDADQFDCAIGKLVENACQAIKECEVHDGGNCGGEIKVETRVGSKGLEIVVSDNGPGIPAEVLPRIFEPLFSTKGFGVGVGLPTVKRILERHGGDIAVTSGPDRGTRALLWLPLCNPRQAAA
jgi:signal transduction histidine kinase